MSNAPAKLAMFVPVLPGGAFTTIAVSLARGFRALGVERIDLVILRGRDGRAVGQGLNVIDLDRRARSCLPSLVRYLRRGRPDVVVSMTWYFNVLAILARSLSRIPTTVIGVEQNMIGLEAAVEHRETYRLRFLPVVMRRVYPWADGIVCCGEDVRRDLLEQVGIPPRMPMTTIPNPLDVDRVRALARGPVDHPWFRDGGAPVVVTVARLARQKGLDVLLRAFARVRAGLPARLWIAGEGPLRPALEALARDLGIAEDVALPGFVPDPYPQIAASGVFVLASAWEGSSIILREAMACGAAVIVNDAPGDSKEVVGFGEHGLMVRAGDHEDLADALVKVLADPDVRRRYQERARERCASFDPEPIARRYLDFSRQVQNGIRPS
jgi:glycosyltransferase involved in cell wall biosynthesis